MLRLKQLRKNRGLSLKEMGDILGVAESTVSLYENSKREAGYSILFKAAEYFNVSIDYLLGYNCNSLTKRDSKIFLPVLDSVLVCDGSIELSFSQQDSFIEIGDNEDYFLFKSHNDLMEPQISIGDISLIKKQNDIENGDIAAVIYDGSPVTINRVIKENGAVLLQPFNPKYKSIYIKNSDNFTVLGKVVETIKKW